MTNFKNVNMKLVKDTILEQRECNKKYKESNNLEFYELQLQFHHIFFKYVSKLFEENKINSDTYKMLSKLEANLSN